MAFNIPIIYIVYKRLDKTKESFQRIRDIQPSKLYIVADGAKNDDDLINVQSVRDYIDSHIDWPCKVERRYATKNMGLRYGIPSGISWAFEQEDRAIIIEDDVVPEISFFHFCEQMLDKYENNPEVMMVSGFNIYENDSFFGNYDMTFSHFSVIWGWATWKRAWDLYKPNIPDWTSVRKSGSLKKVLNKNGYHNFKLIFDDLQFHWYNTWDYQWQFAIFMNGFGIVPRKNLITNIGINDINGEHSGDSEEMEKIIGNHDHYSYDDNYIFKTDDSIKTNKAYDEFFQNNFYPHTSFIKLLKNELRSFIHSFCMKQIQKLESDDYYFNNILDEKYKLTTEEQILNPNSKYKQITASELRKTAFNYWKWNNFYGRKK